MATTRRVFDGTNWRAKNRSDVPAVPRLELPTTPTPWLAFDLITRDSIFGLARKLWSHAFVTFPYGGDGRANSGAPWYQARMPGGTQNVTYGGELRDRPIEIAGITRPRTEPSWWVLDRAEEVRIARAAGHAGFTVDWLNLNDGTGDNRTGQVREFAEAIRYLGVQADFKLILMPDGTTSICDAGNFTAFVNKTVELLNTYPDVFYKDVDGRWIIAPYFPEGAPNSNPGSGRVTNLSATATHDFWVDYLAALAAQGIDAKLWFCYVRAWTTHATTAQALSSVGVMDSRWGDADYVSSGSGSVNNRGAPAYAHDTLGKLWMHPVRCQDNRCNTSESPKFWEAGNGRNLINGMLAAIDGDADMIQNPTWSDFREHAHTMPSIHHGHCWLDLMAYFYQRWATGFWPVIVRDNVFLSHRLHKSSGYTSTGTQTQFMVITGGAAAVNEVEVIAQISNTVGATIEITVNGVSQSFGPDDTNIVATGATGVHRVTVAMPTSGTVSARIKRGGVTVAEIESPHTITNTPLAQDMHYRVCGSLRGVE